jgi:tetratricopeptide (TPR) repeat protein
LQAAVASGRRVPAYLIPAALGGVEDAWGGDHWQQVLAQYQEDLAAAVKDGDQAWQARALMLVAHAKLMNGDLAGSLSAVEQAAPLYQSVGDRVGQANAVGHAGWMHQATGDQRSAVTVLSRAVTLFSGLGYQPGHVDALANLCAAQFVTGNYPAAEADAWHALELSRRVGGRTGQVGALWVLGIVQRLTGDFAGALASTREALDLNRDIGDRVMHGYILCELAAAQRLTGDGPGAAASISEAYQGWGDLGRLDGQALALNQLGQLQAQAGDYQAAAESYRQAVQFFGDIEDASAYAEVWINLGEVESLTGATSQAREHFDQALALARQYGMPLEEARALEGLGRSHLRDQIRGEPPHSCGGRSPFTSASAHRTHRACDNSSLKSHQTPAATGRRQEAATWPRPGCAPVSSCPVAHALPRRPWPACARHSRQSAAELPLAGHGEPQARVGDRQRNVGGEVAEHGQDSADQRVSEQHRVVRVLQAGEERQPEAVVVEDRLNEEIPGKQGRHRQPDQGDHRQAGVAHQVTRQDEPL